MQRVSARVAGLRRSGRFMLLATIAGACVVLLFPALAGAHAALTDTDPIDGAVLPQAPSVVTLTFNEPVEPIATGFQLVGAGDAAAALTATQRDNVIEIALPPSLPDGSYAVGWQVVSADGHPISGAVSFSVGAASAEAVTAPIAAADSRVEVLQEVVQGVAYGLLLAALGLAFFRTWLVPDSIRMLVPARLVVSLAGLALVSAVVLLPLTVVRQQGEPFAALGDPARWWPRVSSDNQWQLLVLGLGVLVVAAAVSRSSAPRQRWGALVGGVGAVASLAITGHTRAFNPPWLIITADVAHAATGALWFGGLLGLVIIVSPTRGTKNAPEVIHPVDAATAVARFSTVAGVLIAVLGLTGLIMGWIILGSIPALLETGYGRLLLVKASLAAVVVAIGAWNRFRLVPAVQRGATGPAPWQSLRRTVTGEALVLVAVVLLTGFLVNQSPVLAERAAPTAPAAPLSFAGTLGEASFSGELVPGQAGQNRLTIAVQDQHGMAVPVIGNVQLALRLPEQELGPLRVEATPAATEGTYEANVTLPTAGAWELTVSARTSRFEQPSAEVPLSIPPAAGP